MNDELTPDERAAMRARILGGARGITPTGAHRGAWIAGSVAAALIVAIAGGVAATSTLSAPEIATSPSPNATAPTPRFTATPTPTLSPTAPSPTPTAPALAFGGDCSTVFDDSTVSAIAGVEMRLSREPIVWDARWLGGISCQWRAQDPTEWQVVNLTVLPWSVVPDEVRSRVGAAPVCDGGGPCDYSERFGDAWVVVGSDDGATAVRAVAEAGARAAVSPGTERPLSPGAWRLADCGEQLEGAVEGALGRDDLGPLGTDNVPQGQAWEVLTARGAASWCTFAPVSYDETNPPSLRVSLAAGARSDPGEGEQSGGSPVEVGGAQAAWWMPAADGNGGRLLANTAGGVVDVSGENLSREQLRAVTAAIISALG